jgi:hypothetical protein
MADASFKTEGPGRRAGRGRRGSDGDAGQPDAGQKLVDRIAAAWTRGSQVREGTSSLAHPLEYDDLGFPILQRPSGAGKSSWS